MKKILFIALGFTLPSFIFLSTQIAFAETVRERLEKRIEARQQSKKLNKSSNIVRDVSYGNDALQRMDVYAPKNAKNAPVIFMVHGGAWRFGDKGSKDVVKNKIAYWLPKGFIVVSTNYRLLPNNNVQTQADDIAQAIVFAQQNIQKWGGDAGKFILMGHSAGAHLVSLINANPSKVAGPRPWLGVVSLDSAALDVTAIMTTEHYDMYDKAFGKDPQIWQSLSPIDQLAPQAAPYLLVCSTRRELDSCANAERFANKAEGMNIVTSVLRQDLSHMDINENLGLENDYTKAVDLFIKNLINTN